MFERLLNKAAELLAQQETFAVATVVRCQAPTSGKPGDKAIIHADGRIWGWVGGGCTQPVVIKEALKALADGRPRLVRISPSENSSEEGIVDYTMTCQSGGALDIYIEPVLPAPHILIIGRSPVAQALARLAKVLNYAVSVAAPEADRESFPDAGRVQSDLDLKQMKLAPQTCIVVCTQGEYDEEGLEQALHTDAAYVAFVASRTKAQKVFEYLHARGVQADRLKQVRAPAGLDIGAATPEEIAVSILAEIIQIRGTQTKKVEHAKGTEVPLLTKKQAKDPVCGMTVDVSAAKYKTQFRGTAYYFCCAGCKQKFDQQPEKHALAI
ncbi:MAG TPA: XdhC family protein [Candidatus Angelobacter sp.]